MKKIIYIMLIPLIVLTIQPIISTKAESKNVIIAFNPSATHIQNEYLKIGIDFYNDNHQMLRIMTKILPNTTKEELLLYIENTYTEKVISDIDYMLRQPNSIHLISPYMRNKDFVDNITTININDIKNQMTNEGEKDLENWKAYLYNKAIDKFSSVNITKQSNINIAEITPQSIIIGDNAIVRSNNLNLAYTRIYPNSPSDGTGKLDTFLVYAFEAITDLTVGTAYGTLPTLTSRDYEFLGDIPSDYTFAEFTGLDIDVEINDLLSSYATHGTIYRDNGSTTTYYLADNQHPFSDTEFNATGNYICSIQGTGESIIPPIQSKFIPKIIFIN